MNQYEIPAMIEDELPAVCLNLKKTSAFGDAIQMMELLVKYSMEMISLHNVNMVIKCMCVVGKIYDKGNTIVKNAVENIFIFSFSSLQSKCSKYEWNMIQAKMPINLYSIYVQQFYNSGI